MPETQTKQRAKRLLHISAVPEHLAFNDHVLDGYRKPLSPWGCFLSIFQLHNETLNILTHGGAWLVSAQQPPRAATAHARRTPCHRS